MDDYYDLGAYTRSITTNSEQAQLWFNRGLRRLRADGRSVDGSHALAAMGS